MNQHTPRSLTHQVQSLRRQFAQAPGLPFADVLADDAVQQAFHAEGGSGYDCVYTPLTTVRRLLAQALDPDPSLRQAVNRLLAERTAHGLPAIATQTGAYCQARQRLPEGVLPRLTRHVGPGSTKPLMRHCPRP